MLIGVQKDGGGFQNKWVESLAKHGALVKSLDLLAADPLEQVRGCDGVMWHWEHYPYDRRFAARPILLVIEKELGIPVFPDFRTAWHFDDKIAQAYLLSALEIPSPKTWVFWDRDQAEQWARTAAYPVVAKLATGAGSTNVKLIRNVREARSHIAAMFSRAGIIGDGLHPGKPTFKGLAKDVAQRMLGAAGYLLLKKYPALPRQYWMPQKNYVLFQEFLPDNTFDTRVTVIGDRAFGYRRFNRPDDFRASGSGNFDVDPSKISPSCVRLAFDAASRLRSQSMAFDILYSGPEQKPVIVEISYCYVDWMVQKCPGHWDSTLSWHEGPLWPEDAHVQDFLKQIETGKSRK